MNLQGHLANKVVPTTLRILSQEEAIPKFHMRCTEPTECRPFDLSDSKKINSSQ
jgi:hypothetical protein